MVGTQFLGAFNDNLFKQLMLLLSLKVAGRDMQPQAMFIFSLAFLLFSGVQFITLGLLGELVTRTYHEVQDKPIYIISETFNLDVS